jgi:CheY-like chemotaxis protein
MADILVVDNNRCINDLLSEVLASDGHVVAAAESGFQALQLVTQKSFEIAFIDLGLPDMDGRALIRELRQNYRSTIPIVISGRSDLEAAITSLKAGAFDYILKPFDIDDIIRIANEAENERKHRMSMRYTEIPVSSVSLDNQKNKLWCRIIETCGIAAAFFLGLIGQRIITDRFAGLTLQPIREMIYLTLSLSFCWAFIGTAGIKFLIKHTNTPGIKNDLIKLAFTYTLFAAILLFVSPLANCGPAMLGGYLIGLGSLTLNRLVIIPRLESLLKRTHEGRKKIVIVGSGPKAEQLITNLRRQFGDRNVESIPTYDRVGNRVDSNSPEGRISNLDGELYLGGATLNHDEVNKLVNNFSGRKVVIDLTDNNRFPKDKFATKV